MNKVLVFDTETINIRDVSIFDIGMATLDLETGEREVEGYLIEEVYNSPIFKSAYYYEKNHKKYEEMLEKKELTIIPLAEMKKIFLSKLVDKDIKYISAFNMNFDLRALNYTFNKFNLAKKQLNYKSLKNFVIPIDIALAFALYIKEMDEHYKWWARRTNYVTEKGNIRLTAEAIYQYIIIKPFEEGHTGIEDIDIEADILFYAYNKMQNKMKFLNDVHELTIKNKRPYTLLK